MFDSAIVGGGPAGMTAAIQLKRMGFRVVLLERGRPGGLLLHAGCVENYPGIEGSLDGEGLVELFLGKMRVVGVEPVLEDVREWLKEGDSFNVRTSKRSYISRTLILAAGTRPLAVELPLFGEKEFGGRVSNDFMWVKSRPPSSSIIIGGGDAAFDYALSLASRDWSVTIVLRKPRPAALGLLVERVGARGNIVIVPKFSPSKIECRGEGALLYGDQEGEEKVLKAHYILTAIGREPENDLIESLELPDNLTGRVDEIPGLFIAGDIRRLLSRQAVIAAGDGMASAMAAARYIKSSFLVQLPASQGPVP